MTSAVSANADSGPAIDYRDLKDLPEEQVLALYRANRWSSADKPTQLMAGLANSHTVITAWAGPRLVGLGNAISDGHLAVYFPHLLVHPEYQRRGIGREIVQRLLNRYEGLHQQVLLADYDSQEFYRRFGFTRAGRTEPMWIYDGDDH